MSIWLRQAAARKNLNFEDLTPEQLHALANDVNPLEGVDGSEKGRLLRRRYHLQDITINQRIAPRGARVFLEQMFDRLPISGSVKRSTLRLLDGTAVNIIILVITAEQAVLIELERSSIYGLPYWIASQQHEERRDDYGPRGIQILRSDRGVTNGPNSPTEWDNHSQGSRSGSAGKGSAVGSGAGKGGTRSL